MRNIAFFFYSDLNLDEELSQERKRDIKKAVAPSKKREAAKNRPGVIKSKRLSEPQPEPVMYSDGTHPSYSPMSLPPGSPQIHSIPQTVLDFSGGESQDSMAGQPHTTTLYQRVPYMQNSQQVIMDPSTYSNAQSFSINESLSSTHPTLSGMLVTQNANNFSTIDENALGQTYLPPDVNHGYPEMQVYPQQQTSHSAAMYSNQQQVSPAPSMYSMQQPSPANSVHSLQSPDHTTQFVTMASNVYGNGYSLHDKLF